MRKKIVAGNWKMHLNTEDALKLNKEVEDALIKGSSNCLVYQFSPALFLNPLVQQSKQVIIGAQNGHPEKSGAFTGAISMHQLAQSNVKAVIIGHSERRQIFGESPDFLKEQVDAAIEENMQVFFCCGETLEQKEAGEQEKIILDQLEASLFHLSEENFKNVIIAYEPIWAIGTGKTATPDEANSMHQYIRKAIADKYNPSVAQDTSILYGGSCKPSNSKELFSCSDIDGGLIGGASLKSEDFNAIISTY